MFVRGSTPPGPDSRGRALPHRCHPVAIRASASEDTPLPARRQPRRGGPTAWTRAVSSAWLPPPAPGRPVASGSASRPRNTCRSGRFWSAEPRSAPYRRSAPGASCGASDGRRRALGERSSPGRVTSPFQHSPRQPSWEVLLDAAASMGARVRFNVWTCERCGARVIAPAAPAPSRRDRCPGRL